MGSECGIHLRCTNGSSHDRDRGFMASGASIACAIVQEHFEGKIGFECVGAAFQYAEVGIDPDKVKPVNGILRKKFPELIRKTGIELFLENPFTYMRDERIHLRRSRVFHQTRPAHSRDIGGIWRVNKLGSDDMIKMPPGQQCFEV